MDRLPFDEARQAELRYLGRMAASISHELRNNLATINEKNGLISDLIALAARGRPLDEARVGTLAGDVARRIKTATEVCDRLSRLAHSPDRAQRVVELGAQVELVTSLMQRQARVAKATIIFEPTASVNVEVEPVLLQLVVYECLSWAIDHTIDRTVQTSVGRRGRDRAFVQFSGASWGELIQPPSSMLRGALTMLGAELITGEPEGEALLILPTMKEENSDEASPMLSMELSEGHYE
jgi:signal transduction histidine kinase